MNERSHWETTTVGDAFEIQLGKMLNKAAKTGAAPKPYLANRNVQWGRIDVSGIERMDFSDEEQRKFSLQPGDLLVCEGGDVGRTALWKGELDDCYFQKAIHRLRPTSGTVLPEFFLHYMRLAVDCGWLVNFTSQTSIAHLTREKFARLPIKAPQLPMQRRMAEILSTVDEAIGHTDALVGKWQQMKAGLMHDLFTRGVTADGQLRPTHTQSPKLYQNSPLGWVPKDWEVDTIGAIFTRRMERGIAGLPIMSIIMSGGMVRRDSTDRRVESNLTPEAHLLVRRGDIAYNMMRMWQGVLGRAEYDGLVSPAYIVMAPTPRIDSVFAEYLLSTKSSIAWFKRRSYGVVDDRLRLYAHDLMRIPLAIPRSLTEQTAIAERLQSLDTSVRETRVSLAKLRQQNQGLMHDLLTGRVRVRTSS